MTSEESNLVAHARRELDAINQWREDEEFAQAILDAVKGFASYGHSGGSAEAGVEMLTRLLRFEPLSALTSAPSEWLRVHDGLASEEEPLWQSRRKPSAFSHDGGKTYYDINEPLNDNGEQPLHTSEEYKSA